MITKLLVAAILIFALLLMIACSKSSPEKRSNIADARDTFLRSCAVCHDTNGEGKPLGGVRAPSLKREEAMTQTDQQLFDLIHKGNGNMPSFKNSLTEEQIKSLVRYIREEIQGRKPQQ